ncbi:MAG: GNAT family N-acetyltransferase [Chloroflexota bacterium]
MLPIRLDDVAVLFLLAQNPATIEDFQHTAQKPDDVQAWVQAAVDDGTPSWTIRLDGQVIGLAEADIAKGAIARMGYFMAEEHQGKGYTTEALQAVLGWLFTQTGVHRAEADITSTNVASRRVVEKLGFRQEGVWRKNWLWGGAWHDSVQYALLRDEWEQQRHARPRPDLCGLKPHTHAERAAIIETLIPRWQHKFGENLIAIAASASYARGEDTAYSDLELEVFLKEMPAGEDPYFQRVVDGMLIEALYRTPEVFLRERSGIAPHWHMSASDRLLPVYNAPFIEKLMARVQATGPAAADFWRAAAGERYKLQENFGKVLNAVEQNNVEGVSLLVMDAVMSALQVLALINQRPFRTFARYIEQARQFAVKPDRFDDLLDLLVQGTYRDLPRLRAVVLAVFAGMERLFEQQGMCLYDDPFDPNLPNPPSPSPFSHAAGTEPGERGGVRLVPVDRSNWRECVRLPTGEDHKHVAPNAVSIAEAQFWKGSKSCCIYHGDELVGYTLYNLEFDDDNLYPLLWVGRLMIAEGQRGKGYGRAALQQIIAEARRQGCVEVALSTGPDNFKAIGLYESLGFCATEMDDDEMVYVLPLESAS